jgi:hypothetical protein
VVWGEVGWGEVGWGEVGWGGVTSSMYTCMRVPSNPTRHSLHIGVNPCSVRQEPTNDIDIRGDDDIVDDLKRSFSGWVGAVAPPGSGSGFY